MPLKLYRRGEIWHYRGSVAGRRLRGSCGTSDKTTAQRIAAEREARQWKGSFDGPEALLTFAQAAIRYRQAGKPTRFLERVENYWKDTPVSQITNGAVHRAALALQPNSSGATRNRQVVVPTVAVINYAAKKLELCRTIKVERFRVEKKEKIPATWEWIEAFMAHASPHLAALAAFMFLTGARISEALSVTWDDVDLQERRALIHQTKIGVERRPHLPPVLVAAIANIPSNREPSAKVFKYSSRDTAAPVWESAYRRAGIKPLSFHSCRHGFATAMLHAGYDPVTVAKLGGWKSPAHLFATYGHAREDDTLADQIAGTLVTQTNIWKAKKKGMQ